MIPLQSFKNRLASLILRSVKCYLRHIPFQRGKSRLRGFAAFAVSKIAVFDARLMPVTIAGETLKLWFTASSGVGVLVDLFGGYETPEVTACIDTLRESTRPVLLDIGANCGLYSIFGAVACAQTRVIAIEPDPDVITLLRRNIAENAAAINRHGSSIALIEGALSSDSGNARFRRSWDNGWGSLCSTPPRLRETIEVRTHRGDDLLRELGIGKIDFCKLDVEGGELMVLRGLTDTLRNGKIHMLQVELNRPASNRAGHSLQDLIEFLRAHDYAMTSESRSRFEQSGWVFDNFCFTPSGR